MRLYYRKTPPKVRDGKRWKSHRPEQRGTVARALRGPFRSVLLAAAALASLVSCRTSEPLLELDAASLMARCDRDLQALERYRRGLHAILAYVDARPDLFPPAPVQDMPVVARERREQVRQLWSAVLDYQMACDSIGRFYARFYLVEGEPQRDAAFLAARAAFLATYRFALDFVERVERDPALALVLDDGTPELALPGDTYAAYKLRFLHVARATEFAALEAIGAARGTTAWTAVEAAADDDAARIWDMGKGRGELMTLQNGLAIVGQTAFAAWFPVQAGVSEWMGDTKVARIGRSLMTSAQIDGLGALFAPGDVVISRREWYLSNIGLPGYWPHAALYVGTPEERRRFFSVPDVEAWVRSSGVADGDLEKLLAREHPRAYAASLAPGEEGRPYRVIEAMSEGVSLTTREHACYADSLAVLRPRLTHREKAIAVLRAFGYQGRPYDFDFDFRTDDALVCTELIFKCYEPSSETRGLHLPLADVLGRPVTPANLLARWFDETYGTAQQELDLLRFLDGREQEERAVEESMAAFRESWRRPKWHVWR